MSALKIHLNRLLQSALGAILIVLVALLPICLDLTYAQVAMHMLAAIVVMYLLITLSNRKLMRRAKTEAEEAPAKVLLNGWVMGSILPSELAQIKLKAYNDLKITLKQASAIHVFVWKLALRYVCVIPVVAVILSYYAEWPGMGFLEIFGEKVDLIISSVLEEMSNQIFSVAHLVIILYWLYTDRPLLKNCFDDAVSETIKHKIIQEEYKPASHELVVELNAGKKLFQH